MATTTTDPDHHLHQPEADHQAPATHPAPPETEKIGSEDETNKEVTTPPAPTSDEGVKEVQEAPTVRQDEGTPLAQEVEQSPVAVEAVHTQAETPPAPVPVAEIVPTAVDTPEESVEAPDIVPPATVQETLASEAAETEPQKPVAVDDVPDQKPTLETEAEPDTEGKLVTTESQEKPDFVSSSTEPDEKLAVEAKEEAASGVVEAEPQVKTELEGEAKDIPPKTKEPAEEIESNTKEVVAEEKREIEAIEPVVSTEATDEPAQELKDLPVEDTEQEIKKEPEEIVEPQLQETVAPSPVEEVTDGPPEDSSESKVVAEEVTETTPVAEDNKENQITTPQESAVAEPCEPGPTTEEKHPGVKEAAPTVTVVPDTEEAVDVKEAAPTETFIPEAEKAVAEEINAATPAGIDAAEGIPKEDGVAEKGEQDKESNAEGEINEQIAKAEELVSTGTENGTSVVEEKLKDDGVVEEEKQITKAEEVQESVQNATANAEDVSGSVLVKEFPDKSNVEAAKEDSKEEEKTGAAELQGEANGSQLETKVEGSTEEVTKESESIKEAAKPDDPSGLEPAKDVAADDTASRDLPVTEVVTKSTPKSSGNIISKVKQSIVKVKKAITGKSPGSKTASAEAKAEERAK